MLRRLAHELRTPLAAIASRAELIRNEQFGPLGDAHYLTYAETIENSANLALQVLERAIQEIVTSAGEPTDSMVATNLSQTLAEVVDMVEPVATDFGVKIQQDRVDGH